MNRLLGSAARSVSIAVFVAACGGAGPTAVVPAAISTPATTGLPPSVSPVVTVPLVTAAPATPAPSTRTYLKLGDTATRNGDKLTVSAIGETAVLCYHPGPAATYTPPGCKKGDGSQELTPPALLVDVTYCVGAGNVGVTALTRTGGDTLNILVGSDTGATGLGEGADDLYYGGGGISVTALSGVIKPGTCERGFLPFQGQVGQPYLMWGDSPYGPDAAWWSLTG
ncbi:MAG: hypothetical protein ABIZ52_07235 [Candidatus Limnocylindrales bacterium]